MQKVRTLTTNFASGELDATALERSDLQRYANAAEVAVNWTPRLQGGMDRAAGTRYVSTVSGPARVEGFEFSPSVWFVLVFESGSLKIYHDDALVQTLATPWTTVQQIWELDFSQALDTMVIAHEDTSTRRLFRGVGDVFTLYDLFDLTQTLHFNNLPVTQRWISKGVVTTLGVVIAPTAAKETGFAYRCTRPGTSQTSEPSWSSTLGGNTNDGTARWETVARTEAEAWNPARGYPRTVTFAGNRLCFGGSKTYPTTRWFSKAGDYFNFDPGTGLADESITDERLSDQSETVQWVAELAQFMSGTTSQEWATAQTDPITPDNFNFKPQWQSGSERISPVAADGSLMHVTKGRNQIAELVWQDVEQRVVSSPKALLNTRCTVGVKQLAVQISRAPTDPHRIYVVNADGTLGVLSVLRDQEFAAWTRRTFDGKCESCAVVGDSVYVVIASASGEPVYEDDIYDSSIYGSGGATITRMLCRVDASLCVDFGKKVSSVAATTTWAGFGHLAGREVHVVTSNGAFEVCTVDAGGMITTVDSAVWIQAGVPLPTPTLTPTSPIMQGPQGTIAGRARRIMSVVLSLYETKSISIKGREIPLLAIGDTGSFTGYTPAERILGFGKRPTVAITAPNPFPATVLSVIQEVAF